MTTPQLWYMCATVPTLLILGNFLFGLYQAKTKFKADRRKEKAAIRAVSNKNVFQVNLKLTSFKSA